MPVTERKSRGVEGTHESSDRRRMTRTNREVSMDVGSRTQRCDRGLVVLSYKYKTLLKRDDEFFKNRTGGVMPLIEKQIFFTSNCEYKLFFYIPSGQGLIEILKKTNAHYI